MKRHTHSMAAFLAVFAVTMAMLIGAHTGASATGSKKIIFCHATGSATNPYVKLTTSLAAFYQSGHVDHDDIYPAGSYRDQSWPAQGDQAVLANGCVVTPPTEEPTEEPTETPTEEPTEEPTETPTETPSETPSETPTVPAPAPSEVTGGSTSTPEPTVPPTAPEAPTAPSSPSAPTAPSAPPAAPGKPGQPEITTETYCLGNTLVTTTWKNGDKVKTSYGASCQTTTATGTPVDVVEEGL